MKRRRECVYGGELDLATLVWTLGATFPSARVAAEVSEMWIEASDHSVRAAVDGRQGDASEVMMSGLKVLISHGYAQGIVWMCGGGAVLHRPNYTRENLNRAVKCEAGNCDRLLYDHSASAPLFINPLYVELGHSFSLRRDNVANASARRLLHAVV
jgi:hypothetical protein